MAQKEEITAKESFLKCMYCKKGLYACDKQEFITKDGSGNIVHASLSFKYECKECGWLYVLSIVPLRNPEKEK